MSDKSKTTIKTQLGRLVGRWLGTCTPTSPGHTFEFVTRHLKPVVQTSRVGAVQQLTEWFDCLRVPTEDQPVPSEDPAVLERQWLYAIAWSVGSLLGADMRAQESSSDSKVSSCNP